MTFSRRQYVLGMGSALLVGCGGGGGSVGVNTASGGLSQNGPGNNADFSGGNNLLSGGNDIFAGNGSAGNAGGDATAVLFRPYNLIVDETGALYVSENQGHSIKKIGLDSNIVLWAGNSDNPGNADGYRTAATFSQPSGMAIDLSGNIYIADAASHVIRQIDTRGQVSTLAGRVNVSGADDYTGTAATFYAPNGLAYDGQGQLYVADSNNYVIRKIDLRTKAVSTVAGELGNPNYGYSDGTGTAAQFYSPIALAFNPRSPNKLFVTDSEACTIRQIDLTSLAVTTLAGQAGNLDYADGTGTDALFQNPNGIALDGQGNLYIADTDNLAVRVLNVNTRVVRTLLLPNDLALATSRNFLQSSVAVDGSGHLYVADLGGGCIRRISLV